MPLKLIYAVPAQTTVVSILEKRIKRSVLRRKEVIRLGKVLFPMSLVPVVGTITSVRVICCLFPSNPGCPGISFTV